MKNNLIKLFCIFFLLFFNIIAKSEEQFNFDVTEIKITEDGNKFIGSKRGTIKTNDGIVIDADQFEYDKKLNILIATGNVKIVDKINKYQINTTKVNYDKNSQIIKTREGSKVFSLVDSIVLKAEDFDFLRDKNIISANKNVVFLDEVENYEIYSEFASYQINDEILKTKGKTTGSIKYKYKFQSEDIIFYKKVMELTSQKKIRLEDETNLYVLSNFYYSINDKQLKGNEILINSNYKLPDSDKLYFKKAIIDLESKNFIAQDPKIHLKKSTFDNSNNDPRLYGVSATKNGNITKINKGIFTSCKKNDDCPPWAVQADEIKHDKDKKQLIYKNAFLKVYNFPVLYFPKFFHPDPTVERQSGFLKPQINTSNILGSSFSLPYFKVISENQDYTFTPTLFDSDIFMIQNEFRRIDKKTSLIADIGFVNGYKSSSTNEKKNISHIFANYDIDLDFKNHSESKLSLSFERVTNDTYLKIFNSQITNATNKIVKPENNNILNNSIKFFLNNEDYNFESGIETYEDLQVTENEKYQYVFPYYNYDKILNEDYFNGSISFSSNGSNNLTNTNNLKSNIINDIAYIGRDIFTEKGFKNNFNIYLKNLNSLGKKVADYKNSPQLELDSLLETNVSLPLIKDNSEFISLLTPQASFRINPGNDMKNYSNSSKEINISNIFTSNRLGIDDSFESGKSLTLGLNYSKEKKDINEINKYFELKLATVFRDEEENFIPKKTTLNKKNSNLFGSIKNNFNDNLNINYNFAIDNNYEKLEYNNLNANLSVNNFITSFNYIKETGEMGNSDIFENTLKYTYDNNNTFSFSTRRNRKINLTEYYNLVYEYKNDCLTAGIEYKKSYYEDRDLKPTENLLFTITLYPLTSFEQEAGQLIGN